MDPVTGYRFNDLKRTVEDLGGKNYAAGQIWNWIYRRSVYDFEKMTDIPAGLRESLRQNNDFENIQIEETRTSSDGCVKLLLKLSDGNFIECVIIPEKERVTLCVSSQVGCRFKCSFCATGRLGFTRNLTASEIVSQILISSDYIGKRITNVVYMGMGEPFDNFDEVIKSADIISDDSGLAIGKRKITISTFGHIDGIRRYIDEDIRYKLAISLHNPFDEERSSVMPANRKYPLNELFILLEKYTKRSNRKVIFEYVLIKGFNDTERHAHELTKLLSRFPSKLNLIKYHNDPENKKFDHISKDSEDKFISLFKRVNFPVMFRK
ncbi:MAG: 23S rRNA (adenine(2503)-C(2))-methyltransferase RlmN, partial [Candidatus Delongbacteria bacterium]|nr:23S rRNA (adenine(2503)-C(2))-methyltransferase RlmN [Candidatus Delongbacteria bacterium]